MCQAYPAKYKTNPYNGMLQWHQLTFITLTVSCTKIISGKEAQKNLMSPFLQWLRRTAEVRCYVWKKELQKRGQPHYHVIIPDMIHYKEVRNKWNELQREAGYLDEYAKQHCHFNPNSTDTKAVTKKNSMAAYIVKELAKSVDALKLDITAEVEKDIEEGRENAEFRNEEIKHRLRYAVELNGKTWDASDNLTGASYFKLELTTKHLDLIEELIRTKNISMKGDENEWWMVLIFRGKAPPDLLTREEKKMMKEHFEAIKN